MKKTKVKIKENITLSDKVHAIEYILSECFTDGEYTPYYIEPAVIVAITRYFLDGFETEDGDDLYEIAMEDKDFHMVIEPFKSISKEEYEKLPGKRKTDYNKHAGTMQYVMDMVYDKLDYQKKMAVAQLTSGNNSLIEEKTLELLNAEYEKIKLETKANKDMAKMAANMEKMTSSLTTAEQTRILKNMAKADFDFNAETIASAVGDKIIDRELKKENTKLLEDYDSLQKKYANLEQLESYKNVLADKPKATKSKTTKSKVTKITDKKKK